MNTKIFVLSMGLFSCSPLWATNCYFTLAKDNCWKTYDVTVNVIDAKTSNQVLSITVPKGQDWVRQTFSCEAGQKFIYKAQFSPAIWESEKGKEYFAKRYWSLPDAMKPGGSAWTINVCYASDFGAVPMPPEEINTCNCDFSKIPAVPPQ